MENQKNKSFKFLIFIIIVLLCCLFFCLGYLMSNGDNKTNIENNNVQDNDNKVEQNKELEQKQEKIEKISYRSERASDEYIEAGYNLIVNNKVIFKENVTIIGEVNNNILVCYGAFDCDYYLVNYKGDITEIKGVNREPLSKNNTIIRLSGDVIRDDLIDNDKIIFKSDFGEQDLEVSLCNKLKTDLFMFTEEVKVSKDGTVTSPKLLSSKTTEEYMNEQNISCK